MNESLKLLKRFALVSLLALCLIAMLCGGAVVNNNSRLLALGEAGQQAGLHFDSETVTLTAGQQALVWPAGAAALHWARLAPAPIGTLVALGQAVYQAARAGF